APMLAWILIGVAFIGVLGQSVRILAGMRSRSRRFGLSSGGWVAVLQVIPAVALLAIVVLESAQGYSFLDSILPGIATWLRVALVGVAWVLVASALTPGTGAKAAPDRPTRIGRRDRRPGGWGRGSVSRARSGTRPRPSRTGPRRARGSRAAHRCRRASDHWRRSRPPPGACRCLRRTHPVGRRSSGRWLAAEGLRSMRCPAHPRWPRGGPAARRAA